MAKVMKNGRGHRIGEGHHKAVLTDSEVAQMLADRGPDEAPRMTYRQLARKWGVSKTCVANICRGDRRAQVGSVVDMQEVKRVDAKKVRVNLTLPLYVRAQLHRLGGAKWLVKAVSDAIRVR